MGPASFRLHISQHFFPNLEVVSVDRIDIKMGQVSFPV